MLDLAILSFINSLDMIQEFLDSVGLDDKAYQDAKIFYAEDIVGLV